MVTHATLLRGPSCSLAWPQQASADSGVAKAGLEGLHCPGHHTLRACLFMLRDPSGMTRTVFQLHPDDVLKCNKAACGLLKTLESHFGFLWALGVTCYIPEHWIRQCLSTSLQLGHQCKVCGVLPVSPPPLLGSPCSVLHPTICQYRSDENLRASGDNNHRFIVISKIPNSIYIS